jgi:hypothetical protein
MGTFIEGRSQEVEGAKVGEFNSACEGARVTSKIFSGKGGVELLLPQVDDPARVDLLT